MRNVNEPEANLVNEVKIRFRRHPIYIFYIIYIMGLNVENIFTSKEKLLIMVTVIEMVICIV